MDDSDSSSLSSAPEEEVQKLAPIFQKAKKATKIAFPPPSPSPPRKQREPSPPHEDVLADNPDIAFLVMFRSRFTDAFPAKMANLGPQDIERGVVDNIPSSQVESLLCALLSLVLNRKKPVERGHYGRALEEAISTQKSQWPHKWAGANPLHGAMDFNKMSPIQRLNLLRTLGMWALTSSEALQTTIKDRYKQNRHNDDENQPLSVQPWGVDGDKRRYFLIQGLDDTGFRVYRDGSRYTKNAHWYNVAGDIEEVKALAKKLEEVDGSQAARRLAGKIHNAVPMFEATEEKRKRREYRQVRRAAFTRPEPGYSLYEGRTRGKRTRYNYDDDDTFESDDYSTRRSARQSAQNTPYDSGPEYTASGRQIKKPRTGDYGESLLSGNVMNVDDLSQDEGQLPAGSGDRSRGRSTRSGWRGVNEDTVGVTKGRRGEEHNDIDDMSEEDDAGDEWDSDQNGGGKDDDDDHMVDTEDDDDDADSLGSDRESEPEDLQSLVVKLKVSPKPQTNGSAMDFDDKEAQQSIDLAAQPDTSKLTQPHEGQDNSMAKSSATATNGTATPQHASHFSNRYTTDQPAHSTAAIAPVKTQPTESTAYPTPASTFSIPIDSRTPSNPKDHVFQKANALASAPSPVLVPER